jgi:nitroreductase
MQEAEPGSPPTQPSVPLAADHIGLLEGLTTTRTIRRYTDEPMPTGVLRDILFAATRAPSGSNRQPFRFVVLTGGPHALRAKQLLQMSAQSGWKLKSDQDAYQRGSGSTQSSRKARMAAAMQEYVDAIAAVPVLIFPCTLRDETPGLAKGASIYPACQNLLLAARGLGWGGAFNVFQIPIEPQLHALLNIPDIVDIAGTITLGRPAGRHGPVRRRPLAELVFDDVWGEPPSWGADPPGTEYAGRPKP